VALSVDTMKLRRIIPTLLLLAPLQLCAAPLSEVVGKALETHPLVRLQAEERLAREAELGQARSGYGPSIDLTAGVGRERSNNSTTRANGDEDRYFTRQERAVTLRQMVFDGFATPSEVDRQQARVSSSAYALHGKAEEVALRTVEVYLDVLRRQELLELARENLAAHQTTYDQIRLRVESGVSRRADLDQVTGRLALAMANVLSEEANLNDARANYQREVGNLPETLERPDDSDLRVPPTLDQAIALALAQHPVLASAEADVKAAEAQHAAARSPMYPRLDLELRNSWNDNLDGQRGDNDDRSVILQMRYNLFNSGADSARLRQTAHQINQAREVRNDTRRQVIESVRLSWNQYQSINAQMDHLKTHVEAAQRSRDAYRKQFNIGKRTLLDLLDSENEVFDASRAWVNARYDRLFAYYRVQQGMASLLPTLGLAPPAEARGS